MAPILATATGIMPQFLDDPSLRELMDALKTLSVDNIEDDFPKLAQLLEPWTCEKVFEEQVRAAKQYDRN